MHTLERLFCGGQHGTHARSLPLTSFELLDITGTREISRIEFLIRREMRSLLVSDRPCVGPRSQDLRLLEASDTRSCR